MSSWLLTAPSIVVNGAENALLQLAQRVDTSTQIIGQYHHTAHIEKPRQTGLTMIFYKVSTLPKQMKSMPLAIA